MKISLIEYRTVHHSATNIIKHKKDESPWSFHGASVFTEPLFPHTGTYRSYKSFHVFRYPTLNGRSRISLTTMLPPLVSKRSVESLSAKEVAKVSGILRKCRFYYEGLQEKSSLAKCCEKGDCYGRKEIALSSTVGPRCKVIGYNGHTI